VKVTSNSFVTRAALASVLALQLAAGPVLAESDSHGRDAKVSWLPIAENQPQLQVTTCAVPVAQPQSPLNQTPLQTPFNHTPLQTPLQTPLVTPLLQTPLGQTPQTPRTPQTPQTPQTGSVVAPTGPAVLQHGRKDDLDRLVAVGRPGDVYALQLRFSIDKPVSNADLVINPGKLEDDRDEAIATVTLGIADGKGGCTQLDGTQTLQPGTYTVVFGVAFARDAHHDQGGVIKLRSGRKTVAKPLSIKLDVLTDKEVRRLESDDVHGKSDNSGNSGKSDDHDRGRSDERGNSGRKDD
jgi:hypothetical protein